MIVVRNILRNAVLHAAPATLTVESVPGGLHFTDTGPGIKHEELPHVFDRYFSNRRADQQTKAHSGNMTHGDACLTGLGLAIAKRVCVMQSWTLDAISPVQDGTGTRFTLMLNRAMVHGQPF